MDGKIRQTVESGVVDGLSEDEVIFYDALVENGSAREVLGDVQLFDIAKVLLEQVRCDATIDWAEQQACSGKTES
ncbi:type I restriction enzyme endonuclease domain-containing protein [Candidatus Minimicrobia naudis]